MHSEHVEQYTKLEKQKSEQEKIKDEIVGRAAKERADKEEDTWLQIDNRVETNKKELSLKIEEGLNAKGDLTRLQKDLRDKKNIKDGLV
jgi:hypothetical protein